MFLFDLFAGWMTGAGWTIFAPGERLPPPSPAEAVAVLDAARFTVLEPGKLPPPAMAKAALLAEGCTVLMPGELPSYDMARDAILGAGCTIHQPGETCPVPEISPNAAKARLEQIGCTILLPGNKITDAKALLEGQNCTVLMPGEKPPFDFDVAFGGLKSLEYTVMRPMHMPELGLWEPKDQARHPSRNVLGVVGKIVHFASGGKRDECTALSFWGWKKRTDATHRPPAPL